MFMCVWCGLLSVSAIPAQSFISRPHSMDGKKRQIHRMGLFERVYDMPCMRLVARVDVRMYVKRADAASEP